ncbi:zinc-dependent alcohol dehydrogenase family protein [Streptosporangium sp. NBC_01756]|uniref:zinc-dependent alcohol dehydrogenase family protein n=1 Tax=Streptosporangium sp. NBC_01756 TaxID=2975950 RepID=UPI002DD90938|nr:zinc-dependent alcohol dehydrogenase family protein [Streptosporangium sp. NBC_01756]WSC87423.1 zinc-dependent alcohol dehydrogenase family protein [Streptosporangium sp. NBC_01756]
MRAVVFDAFGAEPRVREVPAPVPSPGGAVVRVEATGLCRSDWHGWQGHDPDIRVLPHVPGHELAGVVEAVGAGVGSWRPGDRVTVPFVCACGSCSTCATGDQQVCERQTQPGFTHWGSFAEYVAIENADVNLVGLPAEMTFPTAASLGCRFATAFRAVVTVGRVQPGEWVAVHGCGGVGLSAVMIAAAAGARVIAVDVSPQALELAARFGAAATVIAPGGPSRRTDAAPGGSSRENSGVTPGGSSRENDGATPGGASRKNDGATPIGSPQENGGAAPPSDAHASGGVAERIRDLTGGGAHASIDALGSPQTCASSIESLRRRGRHVQIGLLPGLTSLPMNRVIGHELEILGSHGMAAHAYPAMLEMVGSGLLRPDLLVTRTIGLDEAGPALAAIGSVPGVTMILPAR